jgi:hypothetical protein
LIRSRLFFLILLFLNKGVFLIRVCVKGIISFIETNHPQITMWLGLKEKNLSIGIGNLSDFLKYFASGVLGDGLIDRTAILKFYL